MVKQDILKKIEERYDKARSKWDRGVMEYAKEILAAVPEDSVPTKEILLNGAADWNEYNYHGNALIYNKDICERLCPLSECKKKNGGDLEPNKYETWLDVQTRALKQAATFIMFYARM